METKGVGGTGPEGAGGAGPEGGLRCETTSTIGVTGERISGFSSAEMGVSAELGRNKGVTAVGALVIGVGGGKGSKMPGTSSPKVGVGSEPAVGGGDSGASSMTGRLAILPIPARRPGPGCEAFGTEDSATGGGVSDGLDFFRELESGCDEGSRISIGGDEDAIRFSLRFLIAA